MNKEQIKNKFNELGCEVIAFFIILIIGYTIANEMNKQLPKECKINLKKIFLESLFISFIVASAIYIKLSLMNL